MKKVIKNIFGPYDNYCNGVTGTNAPDSGYVCIPKLSIGKTKTDITEPGLVDILSFDKAEKEGAYIGQINVVQVSSFCGLNGLIWGYDLAESDWQEGLILNINSGEQSIPVYNLQPIIDSGESLLGTVDSLKYPIVPGAMVHCAVKLKYVTGPGVAWSALGVGLAKDRSKQADLFMECAGESTIEEFEELREKIVTDMANSVVECGFDMEFEKIFVGLKAEVVNEGERACALAMIPYVTLPKSLNVLNSEQSLETMSLQNFQLKSSQLNQH